MKDDGSTRRISESISDLQSKAKKLREDLDRLDKITRKKRPKGSARRLDGVSRRQLDD